LASLLCEKKFLIAHLSFSSTTTTTGDSTTGIAEIWIGSGAAGVGLSSTGTAGVLLGSKVV
jgi:hypothetical protein